MPYIARGRSRLYYESHGEGLPLVFAHGVGGNHASWFHQVCGLAGRFRVIAFDHRGFGNSTDVEELGRTAFADDLAALFDALGIAESVLIGQSMGGGTCLSFACRYPGRVRGLVLADTLVALRLPDEIRVLMQEAESATANLSQPERVLGATTREERPAACVLYAQIASFNAVTLRTLKGDMPLHSSEELAATRVPVLFTVGEEDVLFPPRAVRALHERVPGSRLVELPHAGHSAHFETPEAFNAALTSWLDDLEALRADAKRPGQALQRSND